MRPRIALWRPENRAEAAPAAQIRLPKQPVLRIIKYIIAIILCKGGFLMNNNSKILAVVSYITWIGWFVTLFLRDRTDSFVRQHLNQAFVLNIISILIGVLRRFGGLFGTIAGLASVCCLIFWVWGIARAVTGSKEPLPLIGDLMNIK